MLQPEFENFFQEILVPQHIVDEGRYWSYEEGNRGNCL